jgi:hypothetical protein
MPRAVWPLLDGQPNVEIVLTQAEDGKPLRRHLLADTGAGSAQAGFELMLVLSDIAVCGGIYICPAEVGDAYEGKFNVYLLRVQLPALGFDQPLLAVGIPVAPPGFDGIACFRFLNSFTYGNFGDPSQFGLET